MTKLLTLCISFLTALRAVLVAKLVILVISPLNSYILPSKVVLVATLQISGILSSIFFILALYTSFLTTSFLQHHLIFLNRQEQVNSLSASNLSTLLFKLPKLGGNFLVYQYLICLH